MEKELRDCIPAGVTALAMELTAVNQYLLHAHTLEDWGLDKLASRMREEMQEELAEKTARLALTQSTGKRRAPRETPAMGLPGTEAEPATLVAAP